MKSLPRREPISGETCGAGEALSEWMKPRFDRRPSCCGDEPCGRAEFVKLITPDDPLEPHVDRVAHEVAGGCNPLYGDRLAECFEYVFELSRECVLFDRFCAAYRLERDRLTRSDTR